MGLLFYKPENFAFDGISSDRFDISIGGYMESSADFPELNRSLSTGEYNQFKVSANHFGISSEDALEISFDIFPKFCAEYVEWDENTSRSINRWLSKSKLPTLLHFYAEGDEFHINYKAVCTKIKDIPGVNGLAGKSLTFVCDSAYGYDSKREYNVFLNSKIKNFKIYNSSDFGNYYPKITLDTGKIVENNDLNLYINQSGDYGFIYNNNKMYKYEILYLRKENDKYYDSDNNEYEINIDDIDKILVINDMSVVNTYKINDNVELEELNYNLLSCGNCAIESNEFNINLDLPYSKIIIDSQTGIITDGNNKIVPYYILGLDGEFTTLPYLKPEINTWKFKQDDVINELKITVECEYPRKVGII